MSLLFYVVSIHMSPINYLRGKSSKIKCTEGFLVTETFIQNH